MFWNSIVINQFVHWLLLEIPVILADLLVGSALRLLWTWKFGVQIDSVTFKTKLIY